VPHNGLAPRSAAATLLLIFFAAHIALLPRTLEDLDSINFALGVRDFDVARHQPHPPGYPVFIALAKVSTAAFRAAAFDAPAARGLAIWSALAGTLALPMLLLLFRSLERREHLAWWAACAIGAAPLYWSTALRPLSDMTGFVFATAAQALLLSAIADRLSPPRDRAMPGASLSFGLMSPARAVILAGLLAGLALGVRSQTGVLTFPLLLVVLAVAGRIIPTGARAAALAAAAVGVLCWGIPLIVASGGLSSYLHALGAQAGQDFSGVVMLWTHRTPRVAANALLNSFVWPWGRRLGFTVCGLAAVGSARLLWRSPRAALVLVVSFGPYAVFHLLFHETETVRYALPLLPPIVYLAMAAVDVQRLRWLLPVGGTAMAGISLVLVLPATAAYAREGAPIFRLFDDMATMAHGGERVDFIGLHAVARRPSQWVAPVLPAPLATGRHGHEWLALVEAWKARPAASVWFAADPKRSDLALFDPRSRDLVRAYRWGFVEPPVVGGARPDNADWYRMQPPGWMLDRGWALTAEVGGVTASDGLGPHKAPSVAWVRRRSEDMTVLLGGRNLGAEGPATVTLTLKDATIDSFVVTPGFFLHRTSLPAVPAAGKPGYLPLLVTARSPAATPVSLEQFDAQGPGVPMFGYDTGWYEPEYSQELGRAWRWTSERSALWVRPIGRPVVLHIAGESPRRYFDAAPKVRVLVADREIAGFEPSTDFDQAVTLPPDLLERANGRVVLESSRFFVPGKGGGGDQRHLALRIYRVSVE
jgi:hypothetical protein